MGGDYARWTFDPARDYAEVFKQQGRVDLDADWNEFVEMVYRRWRAETVDIIGRAVVPEATPDAFFITPTGPSMFTIGIGRMYVDGLLAECRGLSPLTFDPVLGEMDGTLPIPFNQQPYYPNPNPLPTPGPSVDLVYLDVWKREVIALQDPNIREKALGGPDTTTRAQTVWQVKILPNVGTQSCDEDIPAWDTLTAPSAGRLTASTVVPAPSPDPCILSPTGGYRGLENRLYRVEIHTAGTVGGANPATFKWSRDNASVVSGVNAFSASGGPNSVVTLTSLGRDQVLRFKAGDWVEILDDRTEFSQNDFNGTNFVGQPGFLTQISTTPDEANRMITVVPPVPAGLFDPTDTTRHTRVRRWDQRFTGAGSDVDQNTGLLSVSAGPLDIEDGIRVSFNDDPAGGLLHVGDYWLFAARTADGSVEPLQDAPPNGILHHYARLGFMTWNATNTGTFQDCRHMWPPATGDCTGCCTVTVGDSVNSQGEYINDIQGAINSLGPAGGIVCLGRGIFTVTQNILIGDNLRNIIVRGMGWATKIIFLPDSQSGSSVLFDVENTSHISLESFFAVARNAQSLVRFTGTQFCSVRNAALINLNISSAGTGAFLSGADITAAGRAIEMFETCLDTEIEHNILIAAKGIVSGIAAAAPAGAISGKVTVAVNVAVLPLPGATLTVTDANGSTQTATSDDQGQYNFPSVAPGNATVTATASGFATQTRTNVPVVANMTTPANFAMVPQQGSQPSASTHANVAPPNTQAASAPTTDINRILIRDNQILALLSSIFLTKTEECDILRNRLLGLDAEAVKYLQSGELNRGNIDAFQHHVLSILSSASSNLAFQGAGVVLLAGTRITIADNVIVGLIGVFSFLLTEARVRDNQVLALLGLMILIGLLIRVTGNFIAGILAGWLQAGLLVDFDSDHNVWIGLTGLIFMSLADFQKQYEDLFGGALQKAGFASSGELLTGNVVKAINEQGANLGSIGIVALAKIDHDVYLNFLTGIVTGTRMFSGDITIADNSFELCSQAAIKWLSMPLDGILATLLQPIHLVERNTMNITGIGIEFRCVDGTFVGNTIRCPEMGLTLQCTFGRVQDNSVGGTATEANDVGLITISQFRQLDQASSYRITGNRLSNGQGHGILITGSISDLSLEDNVITNMMQNGITTTNGAYITTARVCRNEITSCKAQPGSAPSPGALVLTEVYSDLLVHGNQILGNGGVGIFVNGSDREYINLCLRMQDNSVDGDGSAEMILASGALIQCNGNQASEVQAKLTPVTLIGRLIVVNGNTFYASPREGLHSLRLVEASGGPPAPAASAVATSNILNGAPLRSGFANYVAANNIAL